MVMSEVPNGMLFLYSLNVYSKIYKFMNVFYRIFLILCFKEIQNKRVI